MNRRLILRKGPQSPIQPPMSGSRKRKLSHEKNETSARKRQNFEDEGNGSQHEDDDRPRLGRWPSALQCNYGPRLYFSGDSDSRERARREDQYNMSTVSSTNQPPAPAPGQAELAEVEQLFLRIFSERFSDLRENYDPETFSHPLSEEEIEQMQNKLTEFFSFEETSEETVFNAMSHHAAEYVGDKIFPFIEQHIDYCHFYRTFARIVRVLFEIRTYLDKILRGFAFANYWGETISRECIQKIYTEYGPQLVSVVLKQVREIRQIEIMNSDTVMFCVGTIAKHFTDFDDDVWKIPYLESIGNDTSFFLESFNLQNTGIERFTKLATTRADIEEAMSNSFGFCRNTRKQASKRVYTAFSQKFEALANDEPQVSLSNLLRKCIQTDSFEDEDAARFSQVLTTYGNGDLWNAKRDELKDELSERGNTLIQTYGNSTGAWGTDEILLAMKKFSEYKKSVRAVFHIPPKFSGIKHMIKTVFDRLCTTMFRRHINRTEPEEYLAQTVEYIAMKTGVLVSWRRARMDHLGSILPHLSHKDSFIHHVRRYRQSHDPRNMQRRNQVFFSVLDQMRRVTTMAPEILAEARAACELHLNATQAAETRPDVVYVQYTVPTSRITDGTNLRATDLQVDALMLFTVSTNMFCGQRGSSHIRMTRLQLEVFSFMMRYRRCSKDTIREVVTRAGLFADAATPMTWTNMIIDSLKDANLLAIERTDDGEVVTLGNPELKKPYMEVRPIDPEATPGATEVMFLIDNKVVEVLENQNVMDSSDIFSNLFDLQMQSSYDLIMERMAMLETRNFIETDNLLVSLVPFATEDG